MSKAGPAAGNGPEPLVGLPVVLAFLDVPESTFRKWRRYGKGPKGYPLGHRVKFRLSEVEEWLQQQREAS